MKKTSHRLIFVTITTGTALLLMGLKPSNPNTVRVISWNLKHVGRQGQDIAGVAALLESLNPDLIGLQEVNTAKTGAKGVEGITLELTRLKGEKYCHALSNVPSGARERYAFIWRLSRLNYVKTSGEEMRECPSFAVTLPLLNRRAADIVREPAYGVFKLSSSSAKFLATSIHLVPTSKQPELEVEPLFDSFPARGEAFANLPYLVMGDFNLPSSNPAFKVARQAGFTSILPSGTLTSLKAHTRAMNEEYDAFFVRKAECVSQGATNTYEFFSTKSLKEVYNGISDHVPIAMDCTF